MAANDNGYEMRFSVRYGEIGFNNLATFSALGNWLQEAAGLSADTLGFGEDILWQRGLTWILARLVLRVKRMPHAGEELCVRTWPSRHDRFGYRGYELFDASGDCIASSGSAWMVMRLADRQPMPVPQDVADAFPRNPRDCDAFTCRAIPRLRAEQTEAALLRVRRDDLDINGHVNNTRYLAWLLEPVQADGDDRATPLLMDVTFRAECFPQEELESACALAPAPAEAPGEIFGAEASRCRLHSIRRLGDDAEVCRALTLWR